MKDDSKKAKKVLKNTGDELLSMVEKVAKDIKKKIKKSF